MGLNITAGESGQKFALCPEGTFIARCFGVVDLGTQVTPFLDERTQKPKKAHKVRLMWEILDETSGTREDGKPWVIGKEVTASLHEKAELAKLLKAWRGKAIQPGENFSLSKLIGQYCQVTVEHGSKDGKEWAGLSGVAALHPSMAKPAGINESLLFEIDGADAISVFSTLPEWLQKKVEAAEEWGQAIPAPKPAQAQASPAPAFVDDIPGASPAKATKGPAPQPAPGFDPDFSF